MQTYYKELVEQILKRQNNIMNVNHNMEPKSIIKKANNCKKNNIYKMKKILTKINTFLQSKL